jgi:arginase family enzyme
MIIKVPGINGLGKTKGCEKAGNAILNFMKEIYSNEQGKSLNPQTLELEEIHLDNSNLELTNDLIYKNAFETFEEKPKAIFLGGDHSVSYSLTRAFFDYCHNSEPVKEPCLIVFDAHPDLMPVTKGANSYPTHEEWLRGLIEDGFPAENILLVGARNSDAKEIEFISAKRIKNISANSFLENIEETCDIIMEFASGKELYVSIDIDVIDPVFAPATGYPEVGGLTSRQFLYLIQRINKMKNLKAVDIVEINPEKDAEFNNITTKLGAKILSELL